MNMEQYRAILKAEPVADGHILTLPEEAAAILGAKFVVTVSPMKNSLMLIPLPLWEEMERRAQALPYALSRKVRVPFVHASSVLLSRDNRFCLPKIYERFIPASRTVDLFSKKVYQQDDPFYGKVLYLGSAQAGE